ncbi:MAG: hypothetical protein FWE19_00520 [Oscillospiraceae bacterium]|nr:hypothetical protein [Oscillospiraceae bacterium]
MGVKFTSNKSVVQKQFQQNAERAVAAMGAKGAELTKMYITASGRIETGLMRDTVGHVEDLPNLETAFGIEAFYGIFQEVGTSRGIVPGNFIFNAGNNHSKDFEEIAKTMLGEGFE